MAPKIQPSDSNLYFFSNEVYAHILNFLADFDLLNAAQAWKPWFDLVLSKDAIKSLKSKILIYWTKTRARNIQKPTQQIRALLEIVQIEKEFSQESALKTLEEAKK